MPVWVQRLQDGRLGMKSHGKGEPREAVISCAGVAPGSVETGFGCLCLSVATPQQCSCAGQHCSCCLTGPGLSWAWQGKSKSLHNYQVRETPRRLWSLLGCATWKKILKAAKGHINVSPDREHTFSKGRKKDNLSAYWRQSWEVSAKLGEERALC